MQASRSERRKDWALGLVAFGMYVTLVLVAAVLSMLGGIPRVDPMTIAHMGYGILMLVGVSTTGLIGVLIKRHVEVGVGGARAVFDDVIVPAATDREA